MVTPPVPRTDTSLHTVQEVGKPRWGHTTAVPDEELAPETLWAILPREPILLPSCQQCLQRPPENGAVRPMASPRLSEASRWGDRLASDTRCGYVTQVLENCRWPTRKAPWADVREEDRGSVLVGWFRSRAIYPLGTNISLPTVRSLGITETGVMNARCPPWELCGTTVRRCAFHT